MHGHEEGERSALLVTGQPDLGAELAEVVTGVGYSASVVSSLDLLEQHADARPSLVLIDLALKPARRHWSTLAHLFPHSTLLALTQDGESNLDELVDAFKHGCQDCLIHPVTRDDFAQRLIALRSTPSSGGALDRFMSQDIKLELPSDLSVIEHVARVLAGCCRAFQSYSPRTLINLRIAVSEVLSNAILYGNAGDRNKKVTVHARVDAWGIKVQVADEGPGFDPHQLPDPRDEDAIQAPGGRGLFLVKRLVDVVTFNERGNAVTFALNSQWESPRDRGASIRAGGGTAVSIVSLVERIRSLSNMDLHLWCEGVEGSPEHLAPADQRREAPESTLHWLRTPGQRYALELAAEDDDSRRWVEFARDLLHETLSYEAKLTHSRRDVAERQAEIELLHSVTETLGAVTRLEDAAQQILKEVVRVTGADRASLWIYVPEAEELVLAASEGAARIPVDRVPVSSPSSVSALAFRENRTVRLDELTDLPAALQERLSPRPDPWVAVPVTYTGQGGVTRKVGVLNLIGRGSGAAVSGISETRLLTTLARQIGSAVENLRLFEEVLARERVIGELELAHDLQMKLLPDLDQFDAIADVAARCEPARPVGGDFYQLFMLSEGKIGAMLGDVTSHGFGASLIMALTMSATGIYARESDWPGDLLRAIHRALIQKLESTEMFMTVFFGVIDPARKVLCYANAGHAHAFRLHGADEPQRLAATSPPLGIAEYGSYGETSVSWEPGDVLCLFTDGLTNPSLKTTERAVLQAASEHRNGSAEDIVAAMFEARGRRGDPAPDDQTAFVLRA